MIAFARRFDTAPTNPLPMSDRVTPLLFASLAAVLLLLTLVWQVPMMLWDHLDLLPIYTAWQSSRLEPSMLFAVYGGHLLTLAYCVLLVTTRLSAGHPWLDCVASWVLLVLYAAIVMSAWRTTFATRDRAESLQSCCFSRSTRGIFRTCSGDGRSPFFFACSASRSRSGC